MRFYVYYTLRNTVLTGEYTNNPDGYDDFETAYKELKRTLKINETKTAKLEAR